MNLSCVKRKLITKINGFHAWEEGEESLPTEMKLLVLGGRGVAREAGDSMPNETAREKQLEKTKQNNER